MTLRKIGGISQASLTELERAIKALAAETDSIRELTFTVVCCFIQSTVCHCSDLETAIETWRDGDWRTKTVHGDKS